ncbi:hypothetical protein FSOLCH5_015090 [Fusarium solani]
MMGYQMRAVYARTPQIWFLSIENPQNWSSSRKLLVTVQICILNFGIYTGSSIYTPGELSVMEEFGAREIVATLGLSLFVLYVHLNPAELY